jgi:carbonic anhydrase
MKISKKSFNKYLSLDTIKYDLPAGLVVFLVALPLCLGVALASEAPPLSGLIAGIVGGVVVSLLSGSNLAVTGPAAGLTMIVISSIDKLGNYQTFLMAVVISGVFQVILGFIKAGNIANFFPSSVVKGMLAAIGIILIFKQIPHALGYDVNHEGDFSFFQWDHENTFTEIVKAFKRTESGAIIICLICALFLILWERPMFKKIQIIPGPLLAVFLGICINIFYHNFFPKLDLSDYHLVDIPVSKDWNDFIQIFSFPDFKALANYQVYLVGGTIALVASLETLLSVSAVDKLDPLMRRTPANRELKAQGIGNFISGLIGGLPVTAVIVRGAANVNAGARSKMSAFFHGCFILIAVLVIPQIINMIPFSCLAAILIFVGYKLTRISLFKSLYEQGWEQFLPFIVTIVAIFFTDLLKGIAVGMAVSAFFILRRNLNHPGILHKEDLDQGEKIRIMLAEEVSFLNKASIIERLDKIKQNADVVIDASRSRYIDNDILQIIEEFTVLSRHKNINVELVGFSKAYQVVNRKRKDDSHLQQDYDMLFVNNKNWVREKLSEDENYFKKLAEGQFPKYLFIGCSDSRITANEITGTDAGELFVHRNIANLVIHTDMNLMSVLQYSVEVLKVEHVIVCGHYGCGGVKAAVDGRDHGLIDKWLRNIKDVYRIYKKDLNKIEDDDERHNRLVELNVREQVYHMCMTSIIQKAWSQGDRPHVHGWVYDIHEGLIIDLNIDVHREFKEYEIYKLGQSPFNKV